MNPSHPPLFATLRSFPRAVWVLYFATFVNRFGTFVVPFLALYLTRRGFSKLEAGIALSAYGVGHLFASLLGGQLADQFGRRKTILLSMVGSMITMLLFAEAEQYWAILVLAVFAGLATEIYRPASGALLTDLVPAEHRLTAFAMYRLAINAGWAIGPSVGGFLAAHSYYWLFVGDALTSGVFGLLAWFALPAGLRLHPAQHISWSGSMKTIWRDAQFMRVLAASFLVGIIFMQTSTSFGLEVLRSGHSEMVFGAILSLNGILIIVFELPLTTITRRYAPLSAMALGYLLCGIGFGLNALGGTVLIYAIAMTVFTVGEMISLPTQSAYVAGLAPENQRGRYMGANGLTWALALVIGPSAGMALFEISPNGLWAASFLCGLAAAGIVARIRPVKPAATEAVQANIATMIKHDASQ